MFNPVYTSVEQALSRSTGKAVVINARRNVGGGCINHAQKLETSAGDFFIKTNDAFLYPGMFKAEAKGLEVLKSANAIRVPSVIACGEAEGQSFIILEFIRSSSRGKMFWENFGRSLASLHKNTSPHFGLDHDNYIGSLPQSNRAHDEWLSFFMHERLQKQAQAAFDGGLISNKQLHQVASLHSRLHDFFPVEKPALLHGDLWSGNFMTGNDGEACIMDPAVHYGHREAELAFTHLFGGFDEAFYRAYHEAFPLQPGFELRKDIYNLYPLLVHVNLFGGGYINSVAGILDKLV